MTSANKLRKARDSNSASALKDSGKLRRIGFYHAADRKKNKIKDRDYENE